MYDLILYNSNLIFLLFLACEFSCNKNGRIAVMQVNNNLNIVNNRYSVIMNIYPKFDMWDRWVNLET